MPQKDSKLPIIGGVLAAVGASLCCTGPLVLLLLGVSGSWISSLSLLEPYRPIFILLVVIAFSFSGWKLYRPIDSCEPGTACAAPQVRQKRQWLFWVTGLSALAIVTSNYWIIFFVQ